jgi:hypothetical protein
MAQHRAAHNTHRVRNVRLGIGAFLACMYVIGHNAQQQAPTPAAVEAPLCTPYEKALGQAAFESGHELRLGCVDNGTAALPHCAQEDGSARTESCVWDASVDGNGQGTGVYTYSGADR